MIMAMYVACIRAAAAHRELCAKRGLTGALRIAPGLKTANVRTGDHSGIAAGTAVSSSFETSPIDHLASDQGQIGCDVRDLALRAGEIIPIGDDEVGELTHLYAPLLVCEALNVKSKATLESNSC